jgi:hypothetical protein
MKILLQVSAVLELGAGLALLIVPAVFVSLLIGGGMLEDSLTLAVARVGGAAILALGIACWLARGDSSSAAASGLVTAMLMYNVGVVLILGWAGFHIQPVGMLLVPAVVVHTGMTAWCFLGLTRKHP